MIAPSGASMRALKTSETVARDIVRDIVDRGLKTGDTLPREAAMLEHYRVSRESLREGLRLLEVQGLITIRRGPGGGPVVGCIDPANLGRISTLYYHLSGGTYTELCEAWVVAETLLAEMAALNPNRQLVHDTMREFIHEGDLPDASEDMTHFVLRHTHFHGAIASLADNRVLELMLQTVGQIITHHVVVQKDPREMHDLIARDHTAIARAVAAGHAKKARDLMESHIRSQVEIYMREIGDQMRGYIEWH